MSATINTRIQLKRDTTQHWNEAIGFIPLPGEVIVYEDYETKTYCNLKIIKRKDKNLIRLAEYAKKFNIEKLLKQYMEVLG